MQQNTETRVKPVFVLIEYMFIKIFMKNFLKVLLKKLERFKQAKVLIPQQIKGLLLMKLP